MGHHKRPPFRDAKVCDCGDHGFVGLTIGLVAFFDATDVGEVAGYRWIAGNCGRPYAKATAPMVNRVRGKEIYLHRLIMGFDGETIDHIDGDTLNNRRGNLRRATYRQNIANSKKKSGTSSRFKGVSKSGNRWVSAIRVNGKSVHLGTFKSEIEAAAAYCAAAKAVHGQFARYDKPHPIKMHLLKLMGAA